MDLFNVNILNNDGGYYKITVGLGGDGIPAGRHQGETL
jgi:hypothetical protein